MAKHPPLVSVVVCSFNRKDSLKQSLQSIAKQSYPRKFYEILVIDDGSSDGTSEIAAAEGARVVRHSTNQGIGASRSTGLKEATGEIIVYIDDDCIADFHWLENLIKPFEDSKVVAAGGKILAQKTDKLSERYLLAVGYGNPAPLEFGESKNPLWRFWVYIKSMFNPVGQIKENIEVQAVYAANVAYRIDPLRKIGGFDRELSSEEDTDISSRLRQVNGKIIFVPSAIVHHRNHESLSKFISQIYRRSKNTLAYYTKESKIPPIFPLPLLYVVLIICSAFINPEMLLASLLLSPLIIYPWWLIRAFDENRLEYVLYGYIQLSIELTSILGIFMAFLTLPKQNKSAREIKLTISQIILISIWWTIITLLLVCLLNTSPWILTPLVLIGVIIIPGLLWMLALDVKIKKPLEYFLYSIGLGLGGLIIVSLIFNWASQYIGISHPLAAFPFMVFMEIYIILLSLFAYYRNKTFILIKKLNPSSLSALSFGIIPLVFPILSICGAEILNNLGNGDVTLCMLFGVAIYIVVISIWKKDLPQWVYASAIYSITLALLLMYSLRSNNIIGWDINAEYQVFQMTLRNLVWKMSYYPGLDYNACLSITILPTIFQQLTKVPSEYVFKVIFQLLFATLPLSVYVFAKRYFKDGLALLSAFLFSAQTWFFEQMPALIRQETAFIFYALILLAAFSEELSERKRLMLFYIFTIALILSHYSTAYTWLTLMLGIVILSYIARWLIRSTRKEFVALSATMFAVSLALLLIWEGPITHTSGALTNFVTNRSGELSESLSYSGIEQGIMTALVFGGNVNTNQNAQAAYADAVSSYGPDAGYNIFPAAFSTVYVPAPVNDQVLVPQILPGPISKAISILTRVVKFFPTDIFLVVGIFAIFELWRRRQLNINYQYVLMELVAIGLVGVMVLVPYLQEYYNLTRLYLQMFVVLSVVAMAGGWFLTRKIPKLQMGILAILVVITFFSLGGIIDQFTGGPAQTIFDPAVGAFDNLYIYDSEIASAQWLAANRNPNDPVQADTVANLRLQAFANLTASSSAIFPLTIEENSYVYLSASNVIRGDEYYAYNNNTIVFNYPKEFLDQNKNLIYNDGDSIIYQ